MITITAPLWLWSGESGSWHFVTVPEEEAVAIRAHGLLHRGGLGSEKARAPIKAVRWRTSVFPQKSGRYIVPVKAEVRRRAAIAAGDEVTLTLELI